MALGSTNLLPSDRTVTSCPLNAVAVAFTSCSSCISSDKKDDENVGFVMLTWPSSKHGSLAVALGSTNLLPSERTVTFNHATFAVAVGSTNVNFSLMALSLCPVTVSVVSEVSPLIALTSPKQITLDAEVSNSIGNSSFTMHLFSRSLEIIIPASSFVSELSL